MVFYLLMFESAIFFHPLNNLVVDGHRMESNYQSHYFWFDGLYLLEELKSAYLGYSDTFGGISDQHPLNDLDSLHADIARQHIKPLHYLLVQLLGCLLLEGQRSTYHSVENDPQRPYVPDQPIIGPSSQHFWRSVAGTTTGCAKLLTHVAVVGKPEVNKLDVVVGIQKDVLGLEVAMCDVETVQVFNCVQDLIEDTPSCSLFYPHFAVHDSEELSLLCELGHNEEMVSSDYDFVEVDDVGMPRHLHNFYFPLDSYLILLVFNAFFVNDFDGDFFSCGQVFALLDPAKSALPDGFPEFIAAYSLWQFDGITTGGGIIVR